MLLAQSPLVSARTRKLIESIDAKLNQRCGYESNSVQRFVEDLLTFGQVEVGWRDACGHSDFTKHVKQGWDRVLKSLKKDGVELTETPVKHANKSPTMAVGYWNSVVYVLVKS